MKQKYIDIIEKSPIAVSLIPLCVLGMLGVMYTGVMDRGVTYLDDFTTVYGTGILFIFLPFVLSVINIVTLVVMENRRKLIKITRVYEYITLMIGWIYTYLYMEIVEEIITGASWSKQLVNSEKHPPVWNEDISFYIICVLGFVGYIVLTCKKADKTPPLVTCLSLSAMYLAAVECIIWCVQTSYTEFWVLWVLPINYLIIVVKMVRIKILEYKSRQEEAEPYVGNRCDVKPENRIVVQYLPKKRKN